MSKIEEVPIVWGKDDGVHYVTGTYKKDKPNEEIGYQKWEVRKTYEVEMTYEIVAKTKKEAEDLLERKEIVKVEDEGKLKKIEECIPSEDTDYDTDQQFKNYEDPDWSKDEYEWYKNEDGTNIKKEVK